MTGNIGLTVDMFISSYQNVRGGERTLFPNFEALAS